MYVFARRMKCSCTNGQKHVALCRPEANIAKPQLTSLIATFPPPSDSFSFPFCLLMPANVLIPSIKKTNHGRPKHQTDRTRLWRCQWTTHVAADVLLDPHLCQSIACIANNITTPAASGISTLLPGLG